ncbi:hypothetical protein D3C80_1892990 [compost metagenome]
MEVPILPAINSNSSISRSVNGRRKPSSMTPLIRSSSLVGTTSTLLGKPCPNPELTLR